MQQILDTIRRIELTIASLAFVLMVIVAFSDVAMREITGTGLDGAREAAVLLMILLVLSGFGLATASGRQLRPRFTDGLVPETWQPQVKRFGDLLSAAIFAMLTLLALKLAFDSWVLREATPVLGLPVALIQLVFPLAFGQATLRHLVYFARPALKPADNIEVMAAKVIRREHGA